MRQHGNRQRQRVNVTPTRIKAPNKPGMRRGALLCTCVQDSFRDICSRGKGRNSRAKTTWEHGMPVIRSHVAVRLMSDDTGSTRADAVAAGQPIATLIFAKLTGGQRLTTNTQGAYQDLDISLAPTALLSRTPTEHEPPRMPGYVILNAVEDGNVSLTKDER